MKEEKHLAWGWRMDMSDIKFRWEHIPGHQKTAWLIIQHKTTNREVRYEVSVRVLDDGTLNDWLIKGRNDLIEGITREAIERRDALRADTSRYPSPVDVLNEGTVQEGQVGKPEGPPEGEGLSDEGAGSDSKPDAVEGRGANKRRSGTGRKRVSAKSKNDSGSTVPSRPRKPSKKGS